MPLSPRDWHQRFELQSQWTQDTRDHLYSRAGVLKSQRVLDVGCGTGVLTKELSQSSINSTIGLDIKSEYIDIAASFAPTAFLSLGDAHIMPFKSSVFDFCLCHYLLMWVENPLAVLLEMKRVTIPGGAVLVLAEPDYGGRIDYPQKLAVLNEWQTTALQNQGANPFMGRKLKAIFHQAGLNDIEVGVIGAQWKNATPEHELNSEWEIIQSDLEFLINTSEVMKSSEEIRKIDLAAWATGERIIYVPTFYAWGKVIKD
ncbi:MAG: methyltransferase domain-containing protein [Chloroflexi bacterium]|nr:methyltransferase domain-containing protein [Chloroflexota bacterium]